MKKKKTLNTKASAAIKSLHHQLAHTSPALKLQNCDHYFWGRGEGIKLLASVGDDTWSVSQPPS